MHDNVAWFRQTGIHPVPHGTPVGAVQKRVYHRGDGFLNSGRGLRVSYRVAAMFDQTIDGFNARALAYGAQG
jgi:hypothetical protein